MTLFLYLIPVCIFLAIVVWSIRNGIGPVPSSPKQVACIVSLIPAESHGLIVELGSGWGTLAFALARRFPNRPVLAYENSPVPYLTAKLLQQFLSLPNLQFRRANFFAQPLDSSELVVCYLYRRAMSRLKVKLDKELPAGSFVISNTFAIPGWQPSHISEVQDIYRTKIYLYRTAV
jgi:hypothetical protein